MSRVVDAVAPARMGAGFRWFLVSSWVSNLGDGVMLAAGPLLVASQTRDPFLVAMATLLQRLPWLLFGLQAGVIADRLDRRLIIVTVNLLRAAVLGVLAVAVATDAVNVGVVLAAMFVLGTAETFVDTTASTLLPMMVDRDDLGMGNARMVFGRITLNRLAGPPIGALLFAAGMSLPFVTQAVCMALGAMLISRIATARPQRPEATASMRSDIAEGMRWLWRHPAIRTLTLTVVAFNITWGASSSVLVLYAIERLDLGAFGFGLLTTAAAAGGVLGAVVYTRVERRVGAAALMRGGLIIETLVQMTLAITTVPAVALSVLFAQGMHEAAWGTTITTIRQRAVPTEFQGRVSSVYMVGVFGSLVAGAAIGGIIARVWGITGPFWFGFVGSALILIAIWRQLAHIARTD